MTLLTFPFTISTTIWIWILQALDPAAVPQLSSLAPQVQRLAAVPLQICMELQVISWMIPASARLIFKDLE